MSIGKCGNDCACCRQSSLNCDGNFVFWDKTKKKYNLNFFCFKPYFDVTLAKEVQSKHEINEYCKRNNMVYAGDKELTQQCLQNKAENAQKQEKSFEKNLTEKLMRG